MNLTYAYFRGNKEYNKGVLSKVHAFEILRNNKSSEYPICGTPIHQWGNIKISINKSNIDLVDLCGNCKNYLLKIGERWFLKTPEIAFLPNIKDTNSTKDNRGDSLNINLKVKTHSETTEIMNYVLHEHKLVITTVDGEFKEAKLSFDAGEHYTLIFSDQSLLRLFTVTYKALVDLDLLSDEIIENIEQFIFENK